MAISLRSFLANHPVNRARHRCGTAHLRFLGCMMAALVSTGVSARGQAYTYKSHIEHPIVRYKMSARLDPTTKTVKGHYTLTWWNHTDDTIPDLYFHLYLNAFKNADSDFLRETLEGGGLYADRTAEWLAIREANKWGWVDVDKIQIVGGEDLTERHTFVHPDDDNARDQTVMRVVLPQAIPPHGTIEIAVDFTSKLPRAADRNGYEGDYYLIGQWFPKIGVYEGPGDRGRKSGAWNCHQYHSNTEFYADYGVYDVELTAPSNYIVGATGVRRNTRTNADGTTTYNYFQEDVHEFAWTASPRFIEVTRTFDWAQEVRPDEVVTWTKILNLPADQVALRDVTVTLLVQPDHRHRADQYIHATFNGLKYFGLWYGQYPYDTLTVVDPPNDVHSETQGEPPRDSNTGGMEYPTFITTGTYFWPGKHAFDPEAVTVHEFGHQFWYGLVGNNEFEEAWLDEGFNTYSTGKVLETAYGARCSYRYLLGMPVPVSPWLDVKVPAFPFAGVDKIPIGAYFSCVKNPERTRRRKRYIEHAKNDDLVRNGWQYVDGQSYGVNSYDRVALTLETLESYLGPDIMARVMRTYQQRWRYRHPTTRDFVATVNEISGRNMEWFFQQFFYSANVVDYAVTQVSNELLQGKMGIYDKGGNKVTYLEGAAGEAFEKSKEKRYRSTVLVRRLGEALAPVDVVARFENGETVRERWDGQYRWVKFVYEKPWKVISAEVDPSMKLLLDANFTNNSRVATQDNQGAVKWYVRWIFWLENLFFASGTFS